MTESLWDRSRFTHFPALCRDISTQVLIVGGGMAGLLCGYLLDEAGIDYILCEKKEICSGITKNTTAKITVQHGLIYDKLLKKSGAETASGYYRANMAALKKYKSLVAGIDCGFTVTDSYVYSMSDRNSLLNELEAIEKIGARAEYVPEIALPFETCGAIKFPAQAQFDPLKFAAYISHGMNIFEHTAVQNISGHTAYANGHKISADNIIVATHFPFLSRHGSYFLKLYQSRAYVASATGAADFGGMYIDESGSGLSFRNYGEYLLVGGGSHRTGQKSSRWSEPEHFLHKYYPSAKIRYRFAAQDCISLDSIPYIGNYSALTPELFVAAGFNKWGMTSSMVSAMLLTQLISQGDCEYRQLFSPSRSIMHRQLETNTAEAVKNLLSPSVKRCSHLGCALKWNSAEHTWDCPCHGSRFTPKGKVIDNPAKHGIGK